MLIRGVLVWFIRGFGPQVPKDDAQGEIPFQWVVFRTGIIFVWLGLLILLATIWRDRVDVPCIEIARRVEEFTRQANGISFELKILNRGKAAEV